MLNLQTDAAKNLNNNEQLLHLASGVVAHQIVNKVTTSVKSKSILESDTANSILLKKWLEQLNLSMEITSYSEKPFMLSEKVTPVGPINGCLGKPAKLMAFPTLTSKSKFDDQVSVQQGFVVDDVNNILETNVLEQSTNDDSTRKRKRQPKDPAAKGLIIGLKVFIYINNEWIEGRVIQIHSKGQFANKYNYGIRVRFHSGLEKDFPFPHEDVKLINQEKVSQLEVEQENTLGGVSSTRAPDASILEMLLNDSSDDENDGNKYLFNNSDNVGSFETQNKNINNSNSLVEGWKSLALKHMTETENDDEENIEENYLNITNNLFNNVAYPFEGNQNSQLTTGEILPLSQIEEVEDYLDKLMSKKTRINIIPDQSYELDLSSIDDVVVCPAENPLGSLPNPELTIIGRLRSMKNSDANWKLRISDVYLLGVANGLEFIVPNCSVRLDASPFIDAS